MAGFHMICCVVNFGDASKTYKIGKKYGIKGQTVLLGRGTINNHFMEVLGINEVRKEVVLMVVETELAPNAIKGISKEMRFHKPNRGIAYSYPVVDFIGSRNQVDEISKYGEVKKDMYKIIYAIVDKGKGEDVIEAATKAGSRGGTIVNGRGAGIHEVEKIFSIEIEPEKEVVFILVKSDLKDNIVTAIRSHLKIDAPGNGIICVVSADEVYGLYEDNQT